MSRPVPPGPRARDDVVAELAGFRPLSGASPADRAELAGLLRPATAPAGAVLIRRGDAADSLLLLTSGSVRVEVGDESEPTVTVVPEGSVVGEVALLTGTPHRATVTALTDLRFLVGERPALGRLLGIPGVGEQLVREARQRVASGVRPVPLSLRDDTTVWLRPVVPADRRPVLEDPARSSRETLYRRFFRAGQPSARELLHLADADYVDHFAWVALDGSGAPIGEASYFRSAGDRTEAEISFWLPDDVQGRGLGTLLMGALAVAARHNGVLRFVADVLADNRPMRAVLRRAGVRWGTAEDGVVHGVAPVPQPAAFGLDARTAADLAALVDEVVFPR